ncbi:MAG: hypothetical protein V3S51_05775 [Dehalococcoidia bacterium]
MKGDEEVMKAESKEEIIEALDADLGPDEYEFIEDEGGDPKETKEPAAEEPVTPEPESVPEPTTEPTQVPVQALQDERIKRQAAEAVQDEMATMRAEIAALKQDPSEPTAADRFMEEHGEDSITVKDFRDAMITLSDNFNTKMTEFQGLQRADALMEQIKHGEDIPGLGMSMKDIVETAAPLLNANPAVKAQLATSENPTYELYMIANSKRMQSAFGLGDGTPQATPATLPETPKVPATNAETDAAAALRTAAALSNQSKLPPSQGVAGESTTPVGSVVEAAALRLAGLLGNQEAYHAEIARLKRDDPATLIAMEALEEEAD